MKRKLVKQGAATLMISLPAKWIHQHNLQKGSEVTVETKDDGLIVSTEEIKKTRESKITLVNLTESSIRTLITNTYRRGFNRIVISYSSREQFEILHHVIKTKLIGFDVIKKEENKCIVENITEPSAEHFDQILEKIFLNIHALFTATEERLQKEGKQPSMEDIQEIEERVQKYDNFCRRVLNKEVAVEKRQFFWTFLTLLIHAQREVYHMNKIIGKGKVSSQTFDLLQDALQMYNLLEQAYKKKNIVLVAEIHELEKKLLYKKGPALLEKAAPKERKIIYYLMASIRQFYQANSPLAGLIM